MVEELAEQFEGWETSDKVSELEKDPFGEPGPPPGIPNVSILVDFGPIHLSVSENEHLQMKSELYQSQTSQKQSSCIYVVVC